MVANLLVFVRLWIAVSVMVLSLGLSTGSLGALVPAGQLAERGGVGEACVPVAADAEVGGVLQENGFYSIDHELAHAGGYGLCARALAAR